MDGILIVDKPEGLTSHDVVARLRRILKTKRIGHTGTLDPFATGVLVMLVGKATRLAQFLDKDKKEYEATIRFGFETDTGDKTGSPKFKVQSSKFKVQSNEIESVLAMFRGEIEQTPPMFSAKKVAGKKLYELARKGIEIERKPVKVTIYEIELIENQKPKTEDLQKDDFGLWTLDFGLKVSCSAGTYVRTLAEDIGRKLEIGAHLSALRRTGAGIFDLSQAVTIEELEKIVSADKLGEVLISMSDALAHLPKIILDKTEITNTQNGKKLKFEDAEFEDNQAIRLLDEAENLVAIGFYVEERKCIQPRIVMI
jgi:tRNA pseudouridine55 synthase